MFADLFTIDNLTTFLVLTALETVLGFDNLLYISLEAKKVDAARQASVRRWGMILAIGLRILLLFAVLKLISLFQEPFLAFDTAWLSGAFSGHALIVLAGGIFLIYTAMKEIFHMIGIDDLEHEEERPARRSVGARDLLDPRHEHRLLLRHGAFGGRPDEAVRRHHGGDRRLRSAHGGHDGQPSHASSTATACTRCSASSCCFWSASC